VSEIDVSRSLNSPVIAIPGKKYPRYRFSAYKPIISTKII